METIVLPNNFVELQDDEMMYLDGGWNIGQVVKNFVGFGAITGLAWMGNYIRRIAAANPNISYWSLTAKVGGSLARGFWALPWWAKLAGATAAGAVVYALGEWDLF